MSIRNAGGTGALTVGDGILVVQVLDPSRSAAGAFTLAAGGGARRRLRLSSLPWWRQRQQSQRLVPALDLHRRTDRCRIGPLEQPILPTEPPPEALPPGVFPIIGPEIATYGVVQPIARQLGMTTLGTLHERTGDTSLNAITGTPCPADGDTRDGIFRKAPVKAPTDCLNAGWGPSVWGRVLGQQIDNRYRAFADPRASGQLLGFQSGIDLWRGEWMPGHRDAAGIYSDTPMPMST